MFPASPRNTIRLVVHFRNKKFVVVVTNNATFQDLKVEIVRVYQGISSASADESPPSIAEMQNVYGCVLFSEYPVGTILRDLADVFAFEEGDVPSSPVLPGTLEPSVLPHHGRLQFPMEMHSTPGYLGDAKEGTAMRHPASFSVVPPHAASCYSSLLCPPMADTFKQFPSPRYPDSPEPKHRSSSCTPSAQQQKIISSDTNNTRTAEDGVASKSCDSGFVVAHAVHEYTNTGVASKSCDSGFVAAHAVHEYTNTMSANKTGGDKSKGISLIPATEPDIANVEQHASSSGQAAKDKTSRTKQGQSSSVGESKHKRKRKHKSVAVIVDSDSSDEDGRQKKLPRREAPDQPVKVKGTPEAQTKVTTADQSKRPSTYPGFSSDWTSEDESTSKSKSTDKQKGTKKAKSSVASSTTAGVPKGKSEVGSQLSSGVKLGHSEFGKSAFRVYEFHSSSSFTSSEEDESSTRKQSKASSKSKSHSSIESVKVTTSNQRVASGSKVEHKLASVIIKKDDVSHRHKQKHHELQSKHSLPHKMPKVLGESQEPSAEKNECRGSDRRKKRKGQTVSSNEKHSMKVRADEQKPKLEVVDDVLSSGSQSTFCETHNKTATLYMKSSSIASESTKDPPQQAETDKRGSEQSYSDVLQQTNIEEGHISSKGNPDLTSAPEDVQDIPVRVMETKKGMEAVDEHSSEEIFAEDSQELDVGIIPATQPTARSVDNTADTTVIEETQDVEDCLERSPEIPLLGRTERTSKETSTRMSPERTEKDGSQTIPKPLPRKVGGDSVTEKSEQMELDKLSQHALQAEEQVVVRTEHTSRKAPDRTQNDEASEATSNNASLPKHKAGVKDDIVEDADTSVGSHTGTSQAVQQPILNKTSKNHKAGERLDDGTVESSVSESVPQTSQNLQGSSFSLQDKASGEATKQDSGPKLVVASSNEAFSHPTSGPSGLTKDETLQSHKSVKRKKRKKEKLSKKQDRRKEVDGYDSLAGKTIPNRSGDNTTDLPSSQAHISAVKSTKVLPVISLPDHNISTESSRIDDALQGPQSAATNQPIVPSAHAPSDSKSEHKEHTPESPRSIAGKSLKLRGERRHVSSESDISPAKLPVKKQKLSGSSQASSRTSLYKTPPSAGSGGSQHGSTAASQKKRYRKTAILSTSHRHSDTEAKLFGLSPRKHHPLKKKQSPGVIPSSGQLKRRLKAVTQPTEVDLSSLSQEEAEYSQSISMNLTQLLDDEKLWDEK